MNQQLQVLGAILMLFSVLALAPFLPTDQQEGRRPVAPVTAIVGATIIDGTGAPARQQMTVILQGERITTIGPANKVKVPAGAKQIDGKGLFVLPGFIDVNVHFSRIAYGDTHTVVLDPKILSLSQASLRAGVTTVRDSYGVLLQLRMARDTINAGHFVGPRILFAGNVVGWGGPWSPTWSGKVEFPTTVQAEITYMIGEEFLSLDAHRAALQASITHGVGEDVLSMELDSFRVRFNQYLDKKVDFIKYGATGHAGEGLELQLFNDRQQQMMVEETHKRGLLIETHATSADALHAAIRAGVDLVQHPDVLQGLSPDGQSAEVVLPDPLAQLLVQHNVICALPGAQVLYPPGPRTIPARRESMRKLISAGCRTALATDYEGGEYVFKAMQLLVASGMTPLEAITAATRNGAVASGMLDQIGTVEEGKLADLVILYADPSRDIVNLDPKNIAMVFKGGQRVDRVLRQILPYEEEYKEFRNIAFRIASLPLPEENPSPAIKQQFFKIRALDRIHRVHFYRLTDSLVRSAIAQTRDTIPPERIRALCEAQIQAIRLQLLPSFVPKFDSLVTHWKARSKLFHLATMSHVD